MQGRSRKRLAVIMWRMTVACELFGEDWGKCGRLEWRQWLPGFPSWVEQRLDASRRFDDGLNR